MPRGTKQLALPLERPRRKRPRVRAAGARPNVPHRARPTHDARRPVHVTLRAERGVAYLRKESILKRLVQTFRVARRDERFRVVHFSVQADHVHMIVEASSHEVLTKRMTGLATWAARRINAVARRKGKVWSGRHHRQDLAT